MKFFVIYSSYAFDGVGTAPKQYFIAVPATITDEKSALSDCHDVVRYPVDNIRQLIQDKTYDPMVLLELANRESKIIIPELKVVDTISTPSFKCIVSIDTTCIEPNQWFSVHGDYIKNHEENRLLQPMPLHFKTYLVKRQEEDKSVKNSSIATHYINGHITIDFKNSDIAKDNLNIVNIKFSQTGAIKSRDFFALSCFYENFLINVTSQNDTTEKSLAYRNNFYSSMFALGQPVVAENV